MCKGKDCTFFSAVPYIVVATIIISAIITGVCTSVAPVKDLTDPVFLVGFIFAVGGGCALILTIIFTVYVLITEFCRK